MEDFQIIMCNSNWAIVLASHIMECKTGTSWEDLMIKHLFTLLGIKGDADDLFFAPKGPQDAWGHFNEDGLPCNPTSNPCSYQYINAAAGAFSGTLLDVGKFLSWHVACHNGQDTLILSQEMCQRLHTPMEPIPDIGTTIGLDNYTFVPGYALVWNCNNPAEIEFGGGDVICKHFGSVDYWYAQMYILPGRNQAFATSTNSQRSQDDAMVYGMSAYLLNSINTTDEFSSCVPMEEIEAEVAPTDDSTAAAPNGGDDLVAPNGGDDTAPVLR